MWRRKKTIFLSYRRDDIPGYGRQLQEDLQKHFGTENVFRDVEDIAGGQQWRDVLAQNLANSAALILLIGPRWEQIWQERHDKNEDYIVYELNKAREFGIPIIPVTINGVQLSSGLDLGPISWLMDKQQYDISDRQGRWQTDVQGLVDILSRETGLAKKKQKKEGGRRKWLLVPFALVAVFVVLGYLAEMGFEYREIDPPVAQQMPPVDQELQPMDAQLQNQVPDTGAAALAGVNENVPESVPADASGSASVYPDISGFWQAQDGSIIEVSEVVDGRFMYGIGDVVGFGQFMPHLPSKFAVEVVGIGHGEYSVSAGNNKIMGWFYDDMTADTVYGTLWRVEGGF